MIDEPTPFKGLNIKISVVILIEGRRFVGQGSTVLGEACYFWPSEKLSFVTGPG